MRRFVAHAQRRLRRFTDGNGEFAARRSAHASGESGLYEPTT